MLRNAALHFLNGFAVEHGRGCGVTERVKGQTPHASPFAVPRAALANRATSSSLKVPLVVGSVGRGSVAITGLYFIFPVFRAFSNGHERYLRTSLLMVDAERPSFWR